MFEADGLCPCSGRSSGALYLAWAIPFMLESSVVAIDGRRYFGLFDDAMISMRYAWNLSHGQGLVWNAGRADRGLHQSAVDADHVRLHGAAWTRSARCWRCRSWACRDRAGVRRARVEAGARGDGGPGRGRIAGSSGSAVALMALLYYPLSYWTLTGMETGLLTLLLLAALIAVERYRPAADHRKRAVRGSLPGPGVPNPGGCGHLCRAALHIYGQPAPDRIEGELAHLDPGIASCSARSPSAASSFD